MLSQFDNLITDRTQADVAYLRGLIAKGWDAMTPEEREWFLTGTHKGAYEASDLNRVTAAVNALVAEFRREGTIVPNRKIEIEHAGASRLPEGYTELEYIQSTGTQHIDTGFVVNKTDSYILTIIAEFSNNAYGGANGYMQFTGDVATSKSEIKIVYDGSTYTETIYVDGNLVSTSNWSSYNGTNVKIGLFRLGDAGNSWWSGGNQQIGKLYYGTLSKNDSIVREFLPCKNTSGVIGLYDTVEKEFCGNAGTGDFLPGPESESDSKAPYTWYKEDQPTDTQMSAYLFNVAALKSEINGETELPSSMVDLTVDGANAIERLLLEVPPFMERLRYSKMYSGEVFAGE